MKQKVVRMNLKLSLFSSKIQISPFFCFVIDQSEHSDLIWLKKLAPEK